MKLFVTDDEFDKDNFSGFSNTDDMVHNIECQPEVSRHDKNISSTDKQKNGHASKSTESSGKGPGKGPGKNKKG